MWAFSSEPGGDDDALAVAGEGVVTELSLVEDDEDLTKDDEVVIPAVRVKQPPAPGKVTVIFVDWNAEIAAVSEAMDEQVGEGEILLVPEARWYEALELTGDDSEPTILASRVQVLNSKEVEGGGLLVQVKGIETVGVGGLDGPVAPCAHFNYFAVGDEQRGTAPGRLGDGTGDEDGDIAITADLMLEARLRQLPLPTEARVAVDRELAVMSGQRTGEAARARRYLSTVAGLPWGTE